ncbi:MAG TPA: LysM peptidoglycan-binding domain-containing protein, partial [Anaerolineales bacterium]|nr:LysM peptidoglycan-binding domain-containing protein [Anaerolineales bacterium]
MNDPFTNQPKRDDEAISRKLKQVAEQTQANIQFAAELEETLRSAHRPRTGWFAAMFPQVTPTLRWVALLVLLAVVLSWSIRSLIPAPQPANDSTPVTPVLGTPSPEAEVPPEINSTPVPQEGGFDWRQTKLYLSVPLPVSPAEAKIYELKVEEPATIETALELASRFGIQGEVYQLPGRVPGTFGYMVTDGKQRLYVQSNLKFDYYADYGTYSFMSGNKAITVEQAAPLVDAFLKAHGLDLAYQLVDPQINPGLFYVLPLSPDGIPVYHDYNIPARLEVTIDESGQVILMTSYQVAFEETGTFGIRSVEDAFQQVLGQSNGMQNGILEIMRSAGRPEMGFWSRTYPDNHLLTLYGQPAFYSSAQPGGAPFIGIGQFTATGDTTGIESIDRTTYIEATGQFILENGIRKFNVESWKVADQAESYLSGTLRQDGDRVILTADDGSGEYIIPDAPADLPLETKIPDEFLAVSGFVVDGRVEWNSIQYSPSGSGGGGGGGSGAGFYQLNLSGTPVPFSEPASQPAPGLGANIYTVMEGDTLAAIASTYGISIDELLQANGLTEPVISVDQQLIIPPPGSHTSNPLVRTKLENLRGLFTVTIYRQADGTESKEYSFIGKDGETNYFFVLNGDSLAELEKYHHRPLNVWVTIQSADSFGNLVARLDRVEVPFPDLQFQILRGTQRTEVIDGQPVELFTTEDGTTYVELSPSGDIGSSIMGTPGDIVLHEALTIPDETYGGYPTIRIF